jgi:hypothetical protein
MRPYLALPALLALLLGACPDEGPARPAAAAGRVSEAEVDAALRRLAAPGEINKVLKQAASSRDRRFVAPLIELLRFRSLADPGELDAALRKVLGQGPEGKDWGEWYEWLGAHPEVPVSQGFASWKGELYGRLIDPEMKRFLASGRPSRIRVELIQWGGVEVDGIPALVNPTFVAPAEATYLTPEERVFGVSLNGDVRAYPFRILDWHEMANDVVGGVPVALAYCTLCGAGVLYDARAGGRTFEFGSSGFLYESNKLMFDRQTDTLWNQLTGEPVDGPLAASGITLKRLPVVVTTWARWSTAHPDTRVLSIKTGHVRDYRPGRPYGEYFASPETMFPVWRKSSLLPPKTWVYTLLVNGHPKAYPLDVLARERVVNDTVGGWPVVLVAGSDPEAREVRAYKGSGLTFMPDGAGGIVDMFGRPWRVAEEALFGPDLWAQHRLGGHLAYWFGWYSFYPHTELYRGRENEKSEPLPKDRNVLH